jgi:iron complex outermembrane recepter protein
VIAHPRAAPATVWGLAALVLGSPLTARAQVTPPSPVVQAERMVVEDGADDAPNPSQGKAETDARAPAVDAGWGQVAAQVSNLSVASAGTSSFGAIYSLRGLANTPYFSDPAVTVYLDALPLGGSFSYPTELLGYSNVAIYAGPQPVEFGRGGDGGVIVFSPGAPAPGGEIRLGAGDFGSRSVSLESDATQGKKADLTFTAGYLQREGYIENTQLAQKVGALRAATAFARERIRPTNATEITLEVADDRHRDGAAPLIPLGGPLDTVSRSHEGATDTDFFGAALKATYDADFGRLSETTSFTDWRLNPYDDWLVLPPPLQSHLVQSQENWNEELHVGSRADGPLTWALGGWFSEGSVSGSADRSIGGTIPIEVSDYGYTRHEAALFGDIGFAPAQKWRFSIGGRVQRVDKDYHQDEAVPQAGLHLHFQSADGAFLPKAAFTYAIDAATEVGASASAGTRPGGFAAYTDNPALIPFAAEHVAAFDAHLQHSFARRAFVLSAAAFDYEIAHYQIERSFSASDYFVATAPRARSRGADLKATWAPSRAWSVGLVAGITDVTLLEFTNPLTGASSSHERAPYAPSFTAGLSVAYRSTQGFFGEGHVSALGKEYYTETENSAYAQAAYAVMGARTGYASRRWRLTLYIENAANKGYSTLIIPGVNSTAPGAPRTVGSELALRF